MAKPTDLDLKMVEAGIEMSARFMEKRAEILLNANGGGPTQNMLYRIYMDEAKEIRMLRAEVPAALGDMDLTSTK